MTTMKRLNATEALVLATMLSASPPKEDTQFSLQLELALSSGGLWPALQRLEKRGLLSRAPGRGKQKLYFVTQQGREALRDQWFSLIAAKPPRDTQAALRRAWVPIMMDDWATAHRYLSTVAADREDAVQKAKRLASKLEGYVRVGTKGHRWALAVLDTHALEAEAAALRKIAVKIEAIAQLPRK